MEITTYLGSRVEASSVRKESRCTPAVKGGRHLGSKECEPQTKILINKTNRIQGQNSIYVIVYSATNGTAAFRSCAMPCEVAESQTHQLGHHYCYLRNLGRGPFFSKNG
jgi:hypothetical protein